MFVSINFPVPILFYLTTYLDFGFKFNKLGFTALTRRFSALASRSCYFEISTKILVLKSLDYKIDCRFHINETTFSALSSNFIHTTNTEMDSSYHAARSAARY